jgi:nucleotide-binding universal stress UspA family protein
MRRARSARLDVDQYAQAPAELDLPRSSGCLLQPEPPHRSPKESVMFKHILLPTDGSKLSEKSVKQGVRMAKALNAKVTALHVIPKFHTFTYQPEMLERTRKEYESDAAVKTKNYLEFVRKVAAGSDVECDTAQVASDQPFKEIIKAAQKKGCDLILMASHGRSGIEGFLLGSETQKVLTHSRVPVLVYR